MSIVSKSPIPSGDTLKDKVKAMPLPGEGGRLLR